MSGTWVAETPVVDRLAHNLNVQFQSTTEDVSALYGEAVTLGLQWDRDGFCPNLETLISGVLVFNENVRYKMEDILSAISNLDCEPLSSHQEELIDQEYMNQASLRGEDLVKYVKSTGLKFNEKLRYKREEFLSIFCQMDLNPLSLSVRKLVIQEFMSRSTLKGKELIDFINNRLQIGKKRRLIDSRDIYLVTTS
mmetsp:Transcript_9936/g.26056  ORF Transcript_9936/g.26056 Transcript_9936/m.26056 type:complete len:195 (+) Transcript_9936:179-763(+)